MRQRWYDPTLQRFISRDPIGLDGGVNLYAYVSNSPTNRIDPMGTNGLGAVIGGLIIDGATATAAGTAVTVAGAVVVTGIVAVKGTEALVAYPNDPTALQIPQNGWSGQFRREMDRIRSESNEDSDYQERVKKEREKLAPWGENKAPTEDTGIPFKKKHSPSEGPGKPVRRPSPHGPNDCFRLFLMCLRNVNASLGDKTTGGALGGEAGLCKKTQDNCENSCQSGYLVLSKFWP